MSKKLYLHIDGKDVAASTLPHCGGDKKSARCVANKDDATCKACVEDICKHNLEWNGLCAYAVGIPVSPKSTNQPHVPHVWK